MIAISVANDYERSVEYDEERVRWLGQPPGTVQGTTAAAAATLKDCFLPLHLANITHHTVTLTGVASIAD
jgi:hypothetical protein